jgi:hypothetical protein
VRLADARAGRRLEARGDEDRLRAARVLEEAAPERCGAPTFDFDGC